MGMVVQHNMNALNAYNKLNANVAGMKKSSEKLSSGYRINRAGDDAAGLAVSEKMRSQIKGLNQAIRNSQDGVNMIQTFEGAAQETHSILQRMKELATQSANGTYDNATDRAAMQLEFDQLNDELNQIADTDFNGTIVLNGGEMSDGLRVRNMKDGIGDFDYRNGNKLADIETKIGELEAEKTALQKSAPIDIKATTSVYNTVDENEYDLEDAKTLWADDKLDLNAETDKYVDVTYTVKMDADGKPTYELTKAVSSSGKDVKEKGKDIFAATEVNANDDDTVTGQGGFKLEDANAKCNVIFDASNVKDGDVITLRFMGPGVSPKAPANVGMDDDSYKVPEGLTAGAAPVIEVKVADAAMKKEYVDIFDKLNGLSVFATGAQNKTGETSFTGVKLCKAADAATATALTTTAAEIDLGDGVKVKALFDNDKISITDTAGTALVDITLGKYTSKDVASAATADGYSFGLSFESYQAPSGAGVDILGVETPGVGDPEIAKKVANLDTKIKNLKENLAVSKADSFNNSTARMTYADNITLQTGARTKDSVNFTFKYNNDKSADMGELQANLNLSARKGGLETENLSIANQKDANYAVDQIDKAINKTSMVRASFGAIQNRLEHKITNLTTTSENLTEAESSIRDTDMASEMMNYTKFNILQQAAQSMLAQANQQPQSILQLLG